MRTVWLFPLLLVTFYACSDDGDGGDENTGGRGGSANTAGGSGGGSVAGSGGRSTAGTGGGNAVGSGGSNMAGSGGNAGSAGSGATGCDAYCERSLDECQNDDVEDCLQACERDAELCPSQSADWLECVLPRPNSDFFCLMGVTTPNDDVCDTEYTELLRCAILGP